jgi:hypothetical protein
MGEAHTIKLIIGGLFIDYLLDNVVETPRCGTSTQQKFAYFYNQSLKQENENNF